jgi:hypothetical protein
MSRSTYDPDNPIATLRQTPAFITEVAAGFSEDQLRRPLREGEWSMVQVLAHLHACAAVWGSDIDRMLVGDAPRLQRTDPGRSMHLPRFRDPSFADSLAAFITLREELLALLASLTPEQWAYTGTLGGYPQTVAGHVRRMAKHEAVHQRQFRALRTFLLEG